MWSGKIYLNNTIIRLRALRHVYPTAAVFKLGSADQRGSATGSHGGREMIPKSSNCLHGFNNLRPMIPPLIAHLVKFLGHIFHLDKLDYWMIRHFSGSLQNAYLIR